MRRDFLPDVAGYMRTHILFVPPPFARTLSGDLVVVVVQGDYIRGCTCWTHRERVWKPAFVRAVLVYLLFNLHPYSSPSFHRP